MKAVIFANGQLKETTPLALGVGDLVIAADGGSRHCLALGIRPQVVIGDFDSLEDTDLARLQTGGAEIVRHPRRKDFTDLELALEYAVEQGAGEIEIHGALGQRWDMTLANLLLPAAGQFSHTRIWLIDGPQRITLLRGGDSLALTGTPGDTISLIPIGGDAPGVSTHGLEYPLHNETLYFGATRGVSNVLLDTLAQVSLAAGLLICTHIRHNLPNGEK